MTHRLVRIINWELDHLYFRFFFSFHFSFLSRRWMHLHFYLSQVKIYTRLFCWCSISHRRLGFDFFRWSFDYRLIRSWNQRIYRFINRHPSSLIIRSISEILIAFFRFSLFPPLFWLSHTFSNLNIELLKEKTGDATVGLSVADQANEIKITKK